MKLNILFAALFVAGMGTPYLHAMEKDEAPIEGTAKELGISSITDVLPSKKTFLAAIGTIGLGILGYQHKNEIKEKAEAGVKVISENKGKTALALLAAGVAAAGISHYLSSQEQEKSEEKNKDEDKEVANLFLGGNAASPEKAPNEHKLAGLPEWQKVLAQLFLNYKGADKVERLKIAMVDPTALLNDKQFLKALLPDVESKFTFYAMMLEYSKTSTLQLIVEVIGGFDAVHEDFAKEVLSKMPQDDQEDVAEMIDVISNAIANNVDSKKFNEDEIAILYMIVESFTKVRENLLQFVNEDKELVELLKAINAQMQEQAAKA